MCNGAECNCGAIREVVREAVAATVEALFEKLEIPRMMTMEQFADQVGVSKESIRLAVKRGEIGVYQPGAGTVRITMAEANRWLKASYVPPVAGVEPEVEAVPEVQPEPVAEAAPVEPEPGVAEECNPECDDDEWED